LIEDFIKNTDDTHLDKPLLNEALDVLKVVADEVNISITKHEESEKLIEVSLKLIFDGDFELLNGNRSFVMEGELYKVCRKGNKLRKFLLFNDLLIYAYPQGNKFNVGQMFDLSKTRVTNIKDLKLKGLTNAFQIESESKSFIVYGETHEIKNEWMLKLQRAIKKNSEE